jgi:hypothetical protein
MSNSFVRQKVLINLILLPWFIGCGAEKKESDLHESFVRSTIVGQEGYFRVGQNHGGQWWFITPEGAPFFYKGVCAVNRAGTMGGRRAKDGPYASAVDSIYNYQQNPEIFVQAQIDRLRHWGFNAFGAWTTEEFYEQGFPYTEILEFFKEGPHLEMPGGGKDLPDIFSDQWVQAINNKARTICSPKRHSQDLVGYFTDNEIGFGKKDDFGLDLGFVNAGRFGFSLLRSFMGMEEGVPARDFAWNFIYERHNNLQGLSDAWSVKLRSENEMGGLNEKKTPIDAEEYLKDAEDFQRLYARRYFRLTYETIKRYDPNHLVLGCRFGAPPDTVILNAMKPFVDVISQNNYRPSLYQRIDYLYEETGLPVLIGEFSWNPDLFKYVEMHGEPEDGYTVKERVFRRGEKVLLRAASHPATVGYTWYRWVARPSEGDHFSFGLVDHADQEEMHVSSLKVLHPKIEPIRHSLARQKAKPEDEASADLVITLYQMRPGWIHDLNFRIEDGNALDEAYGWQMTTTVHDLEATATLMKINATIDFKEWLWKGNIAGEDGEGNYTITLQRDGNKLTGGFVGTYNGLKVSGNADGYLLPDLPSQARAFE